MNGQENPVELLVICAVMLVLSILGILGGLSSRLMGSLDGLLMLAVCGMTALVTAPTQVVMGERTRPCHVQARSPTNKVLLEPSVMSVTRTLLLRSRTPGAPLLVSG